MVEQRSPKPSVACSSRVSPATQNSLLLRAVLCFIGKIGSLACTLYADRTDTARLARAVFVAGA